MKLSFSTLLYLELELSKKIREKKEKRNIFTGNTNLDLEIAILGIDLLEVKKELKK